MSEERYLNREIDEKFNSVHEKLDLILSQTTATNGKVRKIILALILLGGFTLGVMGKEVAPVVMAAL